MKETHASLYSSELPLSSTLKTCIDRESALADAARSQGRDGVATLYESRVQAMQDVLAMLAASEPPGDAMKDELMETLEDIAMQARYADARAELAVKMRRMKVMLRVTVVAAVLCAMFAVFMHRYVMHAVERQDL